MKPSVKRSFLDRVRNRVKDSSKKVDKKKTITISDADLSNSSSASSLKALSRPTEDEIEDLPFYDDVTSFSKIVAEDEYLSPPPPRLVQEPISKTPSFEIKSGEIYDDIGSCQDHNGTGKGKKLIL